MPRTRSGLVFDASEQATYTRGRQVPAGWPSWETHHLADGLKIALDYFNLPIPANLNDAVEKRNRRSAKAHGKKARDWAIKWYEVTRFQPNAAATTPGLGHPPGGYYDPAKWKCKWAYVQDHNDRQMPNQDLSVFYPLAWHVSAGIEQFNRVQRGGPIAGGTRARDNNMRLSIRTAAGGPTNWTSMPAATRALIKAAGDNHIVTGGHPQNISYDDLIIGPPDVAGCFMERLPEFLCQLGGKRRLDDFL